MLKQATTVAAASLIAVFMTGCASMPDLYKGAEKDKICKPGDTYEQCCEKRELKKPLKYRYAGACLRESGGNDRDHSTPDTDNPGDSETDSEAPSDQGRGNTGHDHSNDGEDSGDDNNGESHDDGGKNDSRDGGPGQGPGGRGDVGGRNHSALKIIGPVFA